MKWEGERFKCKLKAKKVSKLSQILWPDISRCPESTSSPCAGRLMEEATSCYRTQLACTHRFASTASEPAFLGPSVTSVLLLGIASFFYSPTIAKDMLVPRVGLSHGSSCSSCPNTFPSISKKLLIFSPLSDWRWNHFPEIQAFSKALTPSGSFLI